MLSDFSFVSLPLALGNSSWDLQNWTALFELACLGIMCALDWVRINLKLAAGFGWLYRPFVLEIEQMPYKGGIFHTHTHTHTQSNADVDGRKAFLAYNHISWPTALLDTPLLARTTLWRGLSRLHREKLYKLYKF